MFAVLYGILGDNDDGSLFIDGPYFHRCDNDFETTETMARELAGTKTKNQIMPWVFELEKDETIAGAIIRVRDGWFQKFKNRTMETYQTIQKDQMSSTCPFLDVSMNDVFKQINFDELELGPTINKP